MEHVIKPQRRKVKYRRRSDYKKAKTIDVRKAIKETQNKNKSEIRRQYSKENGKQ